MFLSTQDLMTIGGVMAAVGLWLDNLRARETALALCQRACRREGWQVLDQTVALRRMRLRPTRRGLRLQRLYRFDFSEEGISRHTGYLVLNGRQLEELSFGLSPESDND